MKYLQDKALYSTEPSLNKYTTMRHDWDVHTNIDYDTCITCGLKRRIRALLKGLKMMSGIQFKEYWVNDKWNQPHEINSIGRVCPGIVTDYSHINIQKNEKNPNGAIVIPINRNASSDHTDKRED